ncbi:MAG: twitch domain-containing radical SAM protein, partial [Bdellovibrionales bacterium]|nr:twitch domain-containing radical SAM protein [Bdellovibrionales bacterium]
MENKGWRLDLLDDPRAQWEGFDSVEQDHGSRWRWALGPSQRITVEPFSGAIYLRYSLLLPTSGTTLSIRMNGKEEARYTATKDMQSCDGTIALPVDTRVELSFSIDRFNSGPSRFAQDERPLAFSLSSLALLNLRNSSQNSRDTFCSFPFIQMFINEQGRFRTCCDAIEETPSIDDPDNLVLRNAEDLLMAWNSPRIRKVRREMIQGVWPVSCLRCFQVEDLNGKSGRYHANRSHREQAEQMLQYMDEDGTIRRPPLNLDVKLGNKCNLACRMCGPANSRNLIKEWSAIHSASFASFSQSLWLEDDRLILTVAEACKDLETVRVAGGEPFLTPQFHTFVRKLVSDGRSHQMHLRFSTNCTV